MFDKFCKLNVDKTEIIEIVKRGQGRYGALSPDSDYFVEGWYGYIKEPTPTITVYQKLGNDIITVDEVNKKVIQSIPIVNFTMQEIYDYDLSVWKNQRQIIVNNIEVTFNGIIYQGDEIAQSRIDRTARGLRRLDTLDPTNAPHTMLWTAKDDSLHMLTADDLEDILIDAGLQQSVIWNEGRPTL